RLEQRPKRIPVIFTCPAAAAALRSLAARRISVVHPPWWSGEANDQGTVYWRAAGFDVLQCTRMQPARSRTEVPAAEVFEFVSAHTPHAAGAGFIGGNGSRAVGARRALGGRLGDPVVTANCAVVEQPLRDHGVRCVVGG